MGEEYLRLDPHQKAYFLVQDSKIDTLQSKLGDVGVSNYTEYLFAFADFVNEGKHPKSQLKNYIILLLHYWLVLSNHPMCIKL